MIKSKKAKLRFKTISLILFMLFTGIYTIILMNFSNSSLSNTKEEFNDENDNEINLVDKPKPSAEPVYGEHQWWDKTFQARNLINITNPYEVAFYDYGASITFNYTGYVANGFMNESLKDIRIIEYKWDVEEELHNPYLRKYYFNISGDWVTVWFDTNITAADGSGSKTELDTYLYYGNDNVEILETHFMNKTSNSLADSFGWIRNGNFELDVQSGTDNTWNLFGWNFTNGVPLNDPAFESYTSPADIGDYKHGLSDIDSYHEKNYEGTYNFKWGARDDIITAGSSDQDYIGTLFSYPFVIPSIDPSGSQKLYITMWRNVRIYDGSNSKAIDPFHVRIVQQYGTVDNNTAHTALNWGEEWASAYDGPQSDYTNTEIHRMESETILETVETSTLTNNLHKTYSIEIDPSNYGKVVFLEFITFGTETNGLNAFFQVDDIKFNYTLQTELEDSEKKSAEVTITVKDVDGRIVPNAEVTLVNASNPLSPIESHTESTAENTGNALFTNVKYEDYDYWVNYSINTEGLEREYVVYNSTDYPLVNISVTEAIENRTIEIKLWTIDFEIVDFGKEPMNSGYIKVYNVTSGVVGDCLDNLTLDYASNGKTTFRWRNQSSYYYKVYYTNPSYNANSTTLLNKSYIRRDTYDQLGDKIRKHSVFLNATIPNGSGTQAFTINEIFYTNGSQTELGNKKIISANINVTSPRISSEVSITSISIYYIDKNNNTNDNYLIYSNITAGKPWYRTQIDMRSPPLIPSTLKGDKYEVHGLRIIIIGTNTSYIWGDLNVTFFETTNIYNVTDLCKVRINVTKEDGTPFYSVLVQVNSTRIFANFETELYTKLGGSGYAYTPFIKGEGADTDFYNDTMDLPFWFLRGYNYTFSLIEASNLQSFDVNQSNKWKPKGISSYNYNLTEPDTLSFKIFDPVITQTRFQNLSVIEEVIWGENITVEVNFTSSTDNWVTDINLLDPEPDYPVSLTCSIKTTGIGSVTLLSYSLNTMGSGGYNVTFNSSLLSAGGSGILYRIVISGSKHNHAPPSDISETVYIKAISSTLTMHDYYNALNLITQDSQIFGQSITLTFRYFSETNSPLTNATVTYEWLNLDPINISKDLNNDGYYTATLDTSEAMVTGLQAIEIVAMLENYTTKTITRHLSITERATQLNGETDLVYISSEVWVEDHKNFEFVYKDSISAGNIGDLTSATYIWEELYANGTQVVNETGIGTLVQYDATMTHILDFKTELKSIGNYYLYITLHKQNYVAKSALINLEIKSRIFTYSLPTEKVVDGIITINNGDPLDLNITLYDKTRSITLDNITSSILLQDASISMTFQNKNYTLTEDDLVNGTYSLYIDNYTQLSEDETTTTSTTEIIISKDNFTSQTIPLTIIINNKIFNISFSEQFTNNLITVVSGKKLSFIITLDHPSSSPVSDATLTLLIDGEVYSDVTITNNGDGTYTFTFDSLPEAFTTSKTLSAEIRIEKANYKTEILQIAINVKMQEIFPGVPTFYFILITASILGIAGSAVAYRVIQQARIPKHVKKIRKIKNLIKSKKKVSVAFDIPSKEHVIAKIFGSEWKEIGLSLDEILGLEDFKTRKFSLKNIVPEDKIKKEKLEKKKLEKNKIKKDKLEKKKQERALRQKEKEKLKKEKLEKEKLEQEKLEQEKLKQEKLEQEKLEKEKLEKEKLEQEKLEQEKLEQKKLEQEKLEQEKLEQEKLEQEKLEKEKLEQEKLEQENLEQEKLEQENLEQENLEQKNLEQEKLEQENLEQEKLEQEKLEQEKLEQEKLEQENLEQEKLEKENLEQENLEQENLEQEKLEQEKLEQEKLKQENLEQEKLKQEKLEQEKLKQEKLEQEKLEQENLEQEKLEQENLEQENLEQEKLEQEKLEQEKLEQEKLEQENLEQDNLEQEKLEQEKLEQEKLEQEKLENNEIPKERGEDE